MGAHIHLPLCMPFPNVPVNTVTNLRDERQPKEGSKCSAVLILFNKTCLNWSESNGETLLM